LVDLRGRCIDWQCHYTSETQPAPLAYGRVVDEINKSIAELRAEQPR
jgi:hypothetical protein